MQGLPFAVEVFVAGAGILDWFVFQRRDHAVGPALPGHLALAHSNQRTVSAVRVRRSLRLMADRLDVVAVGVKNKSAVI